MNVKNNGLIQNKRLLSPKNDIVFQCLFGKPENESITRDFISKVLKKEIGELDLNQNPKLIPNYPAEKYGVIDIRAKEKNTKIQYDIEMQMSTTKELADRMLYYWSRVYAEQLKKGEDYESLKPTILIMLLNGEMKQLEGLKEYHTKFKIIEDKYRKIVLTENLEIHIIEIKKYINLVEKDENDNLKHWLDFLEKPEEGGSMEENEEIEKARKELEKISSDEQLRRMAELRERWERDEKSNLREAREEGRNTRNIEIVKKMLEKNISIEIIKEVTGLTEKEIRRIK